MIPSNLIGLVLFVASLGPGYLFVRTAEVNAPRPPRSTFFEAVEMAIVGAVATTSASSLVLLTGAVFGWLDVVPLFADPQAYALEEPLRVVLATAVVIPLSYGSTWFAGHLSRRTPEVSHRPGGTGWEEVIAKRRPGESFVYVTAQLKTGEVFAGQAVAFTSPATDNRELTLLAPLAGGNPDGGKPMRALQESFMVLREQEIAFVTGKYLLDDGTAVAPRSLAMNPDRPLSKTLPFRRRRRSRISAATY